MALRVEDRAAVRRSGPFLLEAAGSPSVAPFDLGIDPAVSEYPEINCLRGVLSEPLLAEAEWRSDRIGVGADRVLIQTNAISEEDYLRRFASHLGCVFDELGGGARNHCPLGGSDLIKAAASGVLPLSIGSRLIWVIAPRGTAARWLAKSIRDGSEPASRFRLTTTERLNRFVFRHADAEIGQQAAHGFHRAWPELSAAPPRWRANLMPALLVGLLAAACAIVFPNPTMLVCEILLGAMFIAWIVFRLVGLLLRRPRGGASGFMPDSKLPVYSIVVALYREASSVPDLLRSLANLDYPAEKLDVKFVVEPDDVETRRAIEDARSIFPAEIIVAPDAGPRTKPKALNVALPLARGSFLVVYDAEDRPEPGQLRSALRVLLDGGEQLACVQACLSIDNTEDSWLSRLFTAEYAGQFDVLLPAIAGLHLPLPLGGSSNHFRTSTLRKVGGWDAYNVTEDADLGMRLARFGYRTDVVHSTTYEEAPSRFSPWLRQRTRWFKGWMQTWLVHMRQPRRLLRDLGLPGFLGFQLMVGGNVLAALVHPLFMAALVYALTSETSVWNEDSVWAGVLAGFYGTTVAVGYLTSAVIGWIGLMRRGLVGAGWVLLLTPLHWLLLSLAAWRALFQLLIDPYRWEKTDHGQARTSRRPD